MATLTSNSIASTYTMLLKMDATGVTSSLQKVEDGDATDSALSISTIAAALMLLISFILMVVGIPICMKYPQINSI